MQSPNKEDGRDHHSAVTFSWRTYWAGVFSTLSVPAIVLFMSFIGYGALTKEAGFTIFLSLFTTVTIYALPGQVVLVDQVLTGAGIATAAFAVTLTAIRLLPLTASLMPVLRSETTPRWIYFLTCHFVAVTVWVEAMRQLPNVPRPKRLAYYLGLCTVLVLVAILGTLVGYYLAANVPPTIQAGLLFLTPIYFFLSLLTIISSPADKLAILLGLAMGPILFAFVPGLDLLLTGLIGGTLAHLGSRWNSQKS